MPLAIQKALDLNVPFVAYSLPGDRSIQFFANPSGLQSKGRSFAIKEWLSDSTVYIFEEMSAVQFLHADICCQAESKTRIPASTPFMNYIDEIEKLIMALSESGGKCVVSRVESYSYQGYNMAAVFAKAAMKAFQSMPNQFVYIFFTKQTGAWLAASPELLLDVDMRNSHFRTLALAGTRPAGDIGACWDDKNCREHDFVVSHIESKLAELNLEYNRGSFETVIVGPNSHIATSFEGSLGFLSPEYVINELHPTPAIAGYPLAESLNQIRQIEKHRRNCYGGTVILTDTNRTICYVTLRCVQFDTNGFAFYGGGGITAQSNAKSEWGETTNKISTIAGFVWEAMAEIEP